MTEAVDHDDLEWGASHLPPGTTSRRRRAPGLVRLTGAALTLTFALFSTARAQDAEFGCKVLLCAAATNPSWPGIPYCVPVMTQLLSMMRRPGFRWPVCSSAGTGAPGYEPYLPCPPGSSLIDVVDEHNSEQSTSMCGRPVSYTSRDGLPRNGRVVCSGSVCHEVVERPVNPRPYYFDVSGQRVWFSLN